MEPVLSLACLLEVVSVCCILNKASMRVYILEEFCRSIYAVYLFFKDNSCL